MDQDLFRTKNLLTGAIDSIRLIDQVFPDELQERREDFMRAWSALTLMAAKCDLKLCRVCTDRSPPWWGGIVSACSLMVESMVADPDLYPEAASEMLTQLTKYGAEAKTAHPQFAPVFANLQRQLENRVSGLGWVKAPETMLEALALAEKTRDVGQQAREAIYESLKPHIGEPDTPENREKWEAEMGAAMRKVADKLGIELVDTPEVARDEDLPEYARGSILKCSPAAAASLMRDEPLPADPEKALDHLIRYFPEVRDYIRIEQQVRANKDRAHVDLMQAMWTWRELGWSDHGMQQTDPDWLTAEQRAFARLHDEGIAREVHKRFHAKDDILSHVFSLPARRSEVQKVYREVLTRAMEVSQPAPTA